MTPESGAAIVGVKQHSENYYRVGQGIAGGFVLAQVFADHVILVHQEQRITVSLPKLSIGTAAMFAANREPAASPLRLDHAELLKRIPRQPYARTVLRPAPWLDPQGHYAGIRVTASGEALQSYGLQRQDVITAVNDHPIGNFMQAAAAIQQMSQTTPVVITVQRGGASYKVPVSFQAPGT